MHPAHLVCHLVQVHGAVSIFLSPHPGLCLSVLFTAASPEPRTALGPYWVLSKVVERVSEGRVGHGVLVEERE